MGGHRGHRGHRAPVPLDSCPGKAWPAKYPIFYLASLFCYIPLQTIIKICVKAKVKIKLSQFPKNVKTKKNLYGSGVTTC